MRDALTPELGRQWSRRVPAPVLVVGPGVVFALMLFLAWDDIPGGTSSITELTSWDFVASSVVASVVVVLLVTAWLAPRVTGWLVLAAILPPVFGPTESVLAQLLWIPWASVLVADAHLRWRQQTLHEEHFRSLSRPSRSVTPRRPLNEPGRLLLSVALVLGALGLAASWVSLWPELRASEERAITASATVTALEDGWVVVQVEGRTWDLWVEDSADFVLGGAYPVQVDPEGRFQPWNDYDVDQGYSAFRIDAAGGLTGVALLVVVLPRVRRRSSVYAGDKTGVRCVARPGPGLRGIEILPVTPSTSSPGRHRGRDDVVAWIPSTWHAESSRTASGLRHVGMVVGWFLSAVSTIAAEAGFGETFEGSDVDPFRFTPPPPWDARVRGMTRDGTCPVVEILNEDGAVVATHVATRPVRGPVIRWRLRREEA